LNVQGAGAVVTMFQAINDINNVEYEEVPLDPRSICNLLLDEADKEAIPLSNLVLQKLLYFAHGTYLVATRRPLVTGYFEAWTYGPVHPGAYRAFKLAGDKPITFRSEREDALTGSRSPISNPTSPSVTRLIQRIAQSYGPWLPSQIVKLSHAAHGPWDFVVKEATESTVFGMRITDDIIAERFKYHKMSVGEDLDLGDLGEDIPFA
jgi:uncharacterized phage-associated protein